MKRKISLIALAVLAAFVFSSCWAGQLQSSLTITSQEGAGTKDIIVEFLKDGELQPNGNVVNQSDSLIGGIDATVQKIKDNCKLDGASITASETSTTHIIKISFSFDSIADYNAKMKTLAAGVATVADATLTVDGDKVTFSEPVSNLQNSVMWAIEAVYNDSALFDNLGGMITKISTNGAKPDGEDGIVTLHSVTVTVGDKKDSIDLKTTAPADTISVTGTIAASGGNTGNTDDTKNTDTKSPSTGDNTWFLTIAVLLLALSGATLLTLHIRKGKAQ